MTPSGPEIGAEIDQVADMLPASARSAASGRRHVQALGTDHQPVQTDELQAFGADDVAILAALRRP